MILSAFSEILTLSAVLPFLSIVINPKDILTYPVASFLINLFAINVEKLSFYIFISFVFIILFSGFVRLITLFITFKVSANIGAYFSSKFYRNLICQSYEDHLKNNISNSLSSMTYHLDETINVLNASLIFLVNFVIAISIVITLSIISFNITFLSALVILSFYILISFMTSKTLRESSSYIENSVNRQYSIIQESLFAIKDIILASKEIYFLDTFDEIEIGKRNKVSLGLFLSNFPKLSLEVLILIVFAFIGYAFLKESNESTKLISLLGVFALGVQKLLPNFQGCYSSLSIIRARKASIINVLKGLRNNNVLKVLRPKKNLEFEFKKLTFKNVSYRYFEDSKFIFSNLNLSMQQGDKIGIIGASGSGKSTFIDILMGLLNPSKGSILINGKILKNYLNTYFLDSWRGTIGHVPQEIFLTNNTIAENIAFGIDKKYIDIIKVKKAAKLAGISNYIEKTEMQYETCFGEDGTKLSGGQKQRVGIARALYNSPQILVLDEATSALDKKTESKVIDSLRDLPKSLTIIFISHRESSLKLCNKIYDLDKNLLKIL